MIASTLALLGALHGATLQAPQDSASTITGHWILNTRDSDDPRSMMPGAHGDGMGDGHHGGGRRPAGVSLPGGGLPPEVGGFPSRGPDQTPEARAAHRAVVHMALEPPATLQLEDGDTAVMVVWAGRDSVRLRPNGHKLERTVDSIRIEYRARHKDGRLAVERRVRDGGRITETYYLSPAKNQLFVLIETEGMPFPLTFRRIYNPAP